MSFVEHVIRCKGQTSACTFMIGKPVKFGTRLYVDVFRKSPYLHSVSDNRPGNKSNDAAAVSDVRFFCNLHGVFPRRMNKNLFLKSSTLALWSIQTAHATQCSPNAQGWLVIFNNFYTRHTLGERLRRLTESETSRLGTVCLRNLNKKNRDVVKRAHKMLLEAPQGTWFLCKAFYCDPNLANANAGKTSYVVWKGCAAVTFYTNQLVYTPNCDLFGCTKNEMKCVHGLAKLRR